MAKRQSLGRGLDALISSRVEHWESEGGTDRPGIRQIALDAILPNPHQPRAPIDEEQLRELAASIKEHGLIQPVIVSQVGGRYQLIAGERRWRAARQAGLDAIPAIVQEATPQKMLELALVENIQRADLNALEEANAYRQLVEEFSLTQSQVAERVGKSRSAVANTLRLLALPAAAQQALLDGSISEGHGRALLGLPDTVQVRALEAVSARGLNVRQTEELVRALGLALPPDVKTALLGGKIAEGHARALIELPTSERQSAALATILQRKLDISQTEELVRRLLGEKSVAEPRPPSPEIEAIQERLRTRLGTKVKVNHTKKGGRIVIHYYSDEELQAILDDIAPE